MKSVLGLALASAFAVLAAGPANAAERTLGTVGQVTYVVNQSATSDGNQGAALARCPRGTTVIGGGVRSTGTDPGTDGQSVNSSGPVDLRDADEVPDDAWWAVTDNLSGGGPSETTFVFAICLRQANRTVDGDDAAGRVGRVSYRRTVGAVPNGSKQGRSARCPTGRTVVGGGVFSEGSFSDPQTIYRSQPSDTDEFDGEEIPDEAWIGYTTNHPPGSTSLDMTVYAICLAQEDTTVRGRSVGKVSYFQSAFPTQDGAIAVTWRRCPRGRAVLGSGLSSTGGFGDRTDLHSSYPANVHEEPPAIDGWVGVTNNFRSGHAPLASYLDLMCLSP